MGDRCNLELTLRRTDLDRVNEVLNEPAGNKWWDEERSMSAEGIVELVCLEANWALFDEREQLAQAGIPFFGHHGEGDDYAGCLFASLDGEQIEVYTDRDGLICVQINEDMRLITNLGYVRAYLEKLRAVEELFGIPTGEAGSDPIDVNEERIERVGEHYLLHIIGDTEPDLHGPYPTEEVRDDTAQRIKAGRGDEDGLYRLDMSADGVPLVRPYGARELETEDAA